MKSASFLRAFCVAACAALFVAQLVAADSPRERLSLDANWKFHLGDDWPKALRLDKAGANAGPASEKTFSDAAWRTVNLPHDWAIELPFDKNADMSHGYRAVGPGFETNSIGWYRRAFELPKADEGKRIYLTFDGVYRDATVFVNGWIVRRHEGGYYPFREDITDVVKYGERNVIAACCRNGGAQGGLNPNVIVEVIAKPGALPWSRSLFNGLAQVIVQSTKNAGEIKLTAGSAGLPSVTIAVQTQPCAPRPSLP